MICWRWRVLFEWLVCSWRHHRWDFVPAGTAYDTSGWTCRRCLAQRPAGRMRVEDGHGWWDTLDVDGNITASDWRYGRRRPDGAP